MRHDLTLAVPGHAKTARGLLVPLASVAMLALAWRLVPDPATPLVLAAAIMAVVVAWWQPAVPAMVCIAFSAFRIQEAYPILYPFQLPLLTAAWTALGLVMAFARGRLSIAFTPLLPAVSALIVWTTVATFASSDFDASWQFWIDSYVKIILVTGALALLIRTERDFAALHGVIVVCGAALGVAAIWNYLLGSQLVEQTRVTIGRDLRSPLGDPNDLAMMLAIALAFTLAALAAAKDAWKRLIMATAAIVILCAISLTQSRGGLLAVGAVFLVVAWRHVRSKGAAIVLCAVGAIALFAAMDIGGRVSGGRGEEGFGESADLRLELWKIAIRRTLEHPLIGIGPQTFSRIAEEFTGHAITVHNTAIQVAVEAGLPGLAAFLSVIGTAALGNYRAERRFSVERSTRLQAAALGSQGALAAFCVAALFLSQGFNWALYLVLAPALALAFKVASDTPAMGARS